MTDAIQKLPDDSANTGKALDLNQTTNGGGVTVYQQRIVVANTPAVTDAATASIDAKIPAPVAGGMPVSLVSVGTIATAAKQDTGNASLASLDTKATANNTSLAALVANSPALQGGAVPVVQQATPATHTDRSGTITTGGTAQSFMAANTGRKGWYIQNLSTGDLWVSGVGTAAAAQPSLKIAAGVYYESPAFVSTSALSIFGATTGQAFTAREY